MITREDAHRFFSQEKVWVWDHDKSQAIEEEPVEVDRSIINLPFRIKNGSRYVNFSLEDPRPKRVFEDGALYPVELGITKVKVALWYNKEDNNFHFDHLEYAIDELSFIGDKLPPELWREK